MSHYHCEVIIPPTDDIEGAVRSVMAPFDENEKDSKSGAFWDFYVIGGRWAGAKLLARYEPAQLEAFEAWLTEQKVTVSGLQWGKQELSPASQIPAIDAKWNEMFPSDPPIPCPLFAHSNDQYGRNGRGMLPADVQPLKDVPERLRIARVIFAGPGWGDDASRWTGPLEPKFMLAENSWNGCNHMPVRWDGSIPDALAQFRKCLENCAPGYAAAHTPTDDWLAVTVDYHS